MLWHHAGTAFRTSCPQVKEISGSIQMNNFQDCIWHRVLLCPMLCSSELRTDCIHWFSRHCTGMYAAWLSWVRMWSTIPTAGQDYKQFRFLITNMSRFESSSVQPCCPYFLTEIEPPFICSFQSPWVCHLGVPLPSSPSSYAVCRHMCVIFWHDKWRWF